jgi:hypothetical protein
MMTEIMNSAKERTLEPVLMDSSVCSPSIFFVIANFVFVNICRLWTDCVKSELVLRVKTITTHNAGYLWLLEFVRLLCT